MKNSILFIIGYLFGRKHFYSVGVDLLNSDFKLYRMYQDGLLEVKTYNPIYNEIYEFQNFLAVNRKISDVSL